jgi:hypothetical protein
MCGEGMERLLDDLRSEDVQRLRRTGGPVIT